MTTTPPVDYLISMVKELCNLPQKSEVEWVEFKHNNSDPDGIGEYISALANSAALLGKVNAYMLWGIEDSTHFIIGTNFSLSKKKIGNEELESWLLKSLQPKVNFRFFEITVDDKPVVLLEIGAAYRHPVQFKNQEYIRIGSYKKKLKDYPEKERQLWRVFDQTPFEKQIALEHVSSEKVLALLDCPFYFKLLKQPLPDSRNGIFDILKSDEMIISDAGGSWNITNLGAALFAKHLSDFNCLKRKSVRVILYKGKSRIETIREIESYKGYACGFEELIEIILNLLPKNEVIGKAFRQEVPMFPELAVRELTANAIIHQDFHQTGTGTMIEIFSDRMEITNPGIPLVNTERFLDSPPKSRNEAIASFLRRIGICEERGSGVDKIVSQTELYQLPAPIFEVTENHTRAILFSHKELREMDKADRIRACYLHACLKYVQRDFMTNTSLRGRFGIEEKNSAIASRFIKDSLAENKIKSYDPTASKKFMKYVPHWA